MSVQTKRTKSEEAVFDRVFSNLERFGDQNYYYFKELLDDDVSKTPLNNNYIIL